MGVAGGFARHRAQAETLVGAEIRGLQPPVVEHQRFALAVLDEQFAVVGPFDRIGHDGLEPFLGDVELLGEGLGHGSVPVVAVTSENRHRAAHDPVAAGYDPAPACW